MHSNNMKFNLISNKKLYASRVLQNHMQYTIFLYLSLFFIDFKMLLLDKNWMSVLDTVFDYNKMKQNKSKHKTNQKLDFLPRHWVSVPLQRPFAKHSLTWEPTNVYPVLQVNIAVAPYTIKVPILFPFGGDGRPPQEITRKKSQQQNKLI